MAKTQSKTQRIIVALLLVGAAVNVLILSRYFLQANAPQVDNKQTRTPITLLLVDAADTGTNTIQTQSVTTWASQPGVQRISSITELQTRLPTLIFGDSVALSRASLMATDANLLRAAYAKGVAVIALNTPLSDLAGRVNASSDLLISNMDMAFANGRIQISMCQEHSRSIADPAGPLPSIGLPNQTPKPVPTVWESSRGCFTDFVGDQGQAVSRVRSLIVGSAAYEDSRVPGISPEETAVWVE
jgi:hypothetical protein